MKMKQSHFDDSTRLVLVPLASVLFLSEVRYAKIDYENMSYFQVINHFSSSVFSYTSCQFYQSSKLDESS